MRLKTVAVICVFIIGSVMASQDELPSDFIAKRPRIEAPQEQPSGSQEPTAGQKDEPASGVIVAKPKRKVSKEQPSGPQVPITGREGEPSGVIVVRSKLSKQEQSDSAQGESGGNVLLRDVDKIASLEKVIQAVEKNIRKIVFDKDIGTDKNIFEAIMEAKGKSLSFLFELASPKVLEALTKQDKRPKVREWAEEAIKVKERLEQSVSVQFNFEDNYYDAIIELIGGITTIGVEFTRNKFLTDGVYASVLDREGLNVICFQLLLDSATPAAIRLALNSKWLTHRFDPQDSALVKKAKSRHSDLEEAYKKYAEPSIARQLGIAPGKDGHYSVPELSEHIASFLQPHPIENDIITEPSGRSNLSILEPFKVYRKDGIPKAIIELAVGKEQAEGVKLNDEQVKQVRPYGPALVTHIFENKLDIEQFLDRTGLYADYETFVAFMDMYGPDICKASVEKDEENEENEEDEEDEEDKIVHVFRRFKDTLGGRYMVRALFCVRNFYAALSLYDAIPWEKPFIEDRLHFLAKVTRFPLNAFPIAMQVMGDGSWFERRASAIRAKRIKNIREAAEKGNLDYLREHLLDGNVTEHGLQSILGHGSAIPIEAFKLILNVIDHSFDNFAHMTSEQRALAEGHNALLDQLDRACWENNLEAIRTLLANPNCTPGMRVGIFLNYRSYGILVEELIPDNCGLLLGKWMNWGAPRSAALDAVINRCLQCHAAKHKLVKSP